MATNTTNYNLIKPEDTDMASQTPFNTNMDTLDAALKAVSDAANATETFEAIYNSTTSAELEAAYQAEKVIYCKYNSRIYVLVYRSSSTAHHFTSFHAKTLYKLNCNNNTWSTDSTEFAPKDSPSFTNNPTAPTQEAGNNSQRLATTAFVQTAISNADDVFVATYGTTSNADIETAYQAGKIVYCKYSSRLYILTYRNSTASHYFTSLYGQTQYTLHCLQGTWTSTYTNLAEKNKVLGYVNHSQGLSVTFAAGQSVVNLDMWDNFGEIYEKNTTATFTTDGDSIAVIDEDESVIRLSRTEATSVLNTVLIIIDFNRP